MRWYPSPFNHEPWAMFAELRPGRLSEPLTGRAWDRRTVQNQVRRRMTRYAALGLGRSDRVLFHHGNSLEFFADLLAIWSLGACAIPLDSRLTAFEVETLAAAAAPRLSIWKDSPDSAIEVCLVNRGISVVDALEVEEAPKRTARVAASSDRPLLDDDALILFTSGTTGNPKGVVHTHRSLRARWSALHSCVGLDDFRRTLCLLPTHFGHGLICNCLYPWLSGRELCILPPFKLDVLARLGSILDDFEISFMSSVPTVWRLALKAARPPRSATLGRVFCGSAPLSAALWNSIRDWTGAGEVLNAYGITETASWLAGTTIPGFTPADGLIGVAWGGAIKVLPTSDTQRSPALVQECAPGETGYIWTRTPALMKGYLGREDLTRAVVRDEWLSTGDIGFVDDRGVLYLRGREREEINKGGTKIHPGDIDAVVERFVDTIEACCFGYDDPFLGQDVGIAVTLRADDEATLRRLFAWARRHLASHQIPQRWYLTPEIPRNSRGKVNRAAVAAGCAGLRPLDVRRISQPGDA